MTERKNVLVPVDDLDLAIEWALVGMQKYFTTGKKQKRIEKLQQLRDQPETCVWEDETQTPWGSERTYRNCLGHQVTYRGCVAQNGSQFKYCPYCQKPIEVK